MANVSSTATVNLNINGEAAHDTIKKLKSDLEDLRKKRDECASNGDVKGAKKYQRELERTQKKLNDLTDAQANFEHTLKNLDKVSLNELQKTLKQLRRELGKMEQGTDVWNEQVIQIRSVRAQIESVNRALRATESESKGFFGFLQTWQTALSSAFGYALDILTGVVRYAREAAEAFVSMDQEMANVRKYTGMSEEQVVSLNEAFRKLDTRSSREQLNQLAQEAGRLGKTSQEDVLGFVKAADKINVALDDLGDGATLTLSKLTGIFGDEQRLGTEKALLSVGSVINELSQNCSASAPYLAEFASRMGGVGAQAGMTVQQIMAFGAVLDTNNMNVEAASTALQQLVVHLYQKPAEYAKVVGLDVQRFSKLVREDMNSAVIELLETIQKSGKMDVLAPMFKDMGENGTNAIKALSSLAGHIEDVKNQQVAANEAFAAATSIDQEFQVQNTTKAASLDKQKKELQELRIEMGQKLLPIVHLANSSGLVAMKILNSVTSFLLANKGAILGLATAYVTYVTVANAALIKKYALIAVDKIGLALTAAKRSAILLLSAAKALLTGNISKASMAMKTLNATMAASPWGLIIAAAAALISMLVTLITKTDETTKAMNNAMKSANSFAGALEKEKTELDKLFGTLEGAKKGTEEYQKAKDAIISKYGAYLTGLINEKGEIINLAAAYDRLTWAAQRSAQARAIANAKENIHSEYITGIDKQLQNLSETLIKFNVPQKNVSTIIAKVGQFFGTNGDTNSPEWKGIVKDVLNSTKGSTIMPWEDNPLNILLRMGGYSKKKEDHLRTLETLENKNLRHLSDETLDESIKNLSSQLQKDSKNLIEISIPVGNIQNGQTIANMITAGTKIVPGKRQAEQQPAENPFALKGIQQNNYSGTTAEMQAVQNAAAKTHPREANVKFEFHSFPMKNAGVMDGVITREQAENLLREMVWEQSQRGLGSSSEPETPSFEPSGKGYSSSKEADKERKKQEAAARRAAAKARKEFKAELDAVKGEWETGDAGNIASFRQGLQSWSEFLENKYNLHVKYLDDSMKVYESHNLQEDEDYAELLKKKEQLTADWLKRRQAMTVQDAQEQQKQEEMQAQLDFSTPGSALFQKEEALQLRLHDIKIKYLEKMRAAYAKDSEEYHKYTIQITTAEEEEKLRIRKRFAQLYIKFSTEYELKSAAEKYKDEIAFLTALFAGRKISLEKYLKELEKLRKENVEDKMPDSAKPVKSESDQDAEAMQKDLDKLQEMFNAKLLTEEEYLKARERIEAEYEKRAIARAKQSGGEFGAMVLDIYEAFKAFGEEGGGNIFQKISGAVQASFAVINAAMSAYTEFAKAQADVTIAAVEKRYDAEAALAEGNVYKQKQAEKKKQKEIAKIKNEANKKQFAMQIFQAIAQTATNALNAFGAMASIPVVGPALAAAAAAMAVAAGMVQVATLRKQAQASEAAGYMEGGFTPKGRKDQAVGVVHAGEWVAPQEIVNSPVTRPIINLLENARRNNRVSSIRHADVSAVTAPALATRAAQQRVEVVYQQPQEQSGSNSELTEVMEKLSRQLSEPIVAITSITGEHGIIRNLDDYNRLIKNKSYRQ